MQVHEKCAMKEEKKQCALNNFIEGTSFIICYQRNGWMDLSELQAMYSLHNEDINTLVMGGLG